MATLPKRDRIPIPWRTRWHRFCYRVLPVLTFVGAILAVGRMWLGQGTMPNAIGRVEAVRVNITAGADGKLLPLAELANGQWKQFADVLEGQIVARLDDRPLRALLEALRSEASALQAELASTQSETMLDQFDRRQQHLREATELAYQIERYRLSALEQLALVEEARLELQRTDSQLDLLNRAYGGGAGLHGEVANLQSERAALEKLLQTRTAALQQAEDNLQAAQTRQASFPSLENADLSVLLAPVRDSILAAEARIDQASAQIDALVVRSPISGMVAAVHAHPGQGVRTGDWILTIAANEADSIVGYIPAVNRFRPAEGMRVGVRLRIPGSRMLPSTVQRVGSQWEPMPPELLADPQMPQLALPVRIGIPAGLVVRPGELVDIRFYRQETQQLVRRSPSPSRLYASLRRESPRP